MRGINTLAWLATLVLGLHTINCVETVVEPQPEINSELRSLSERPVSPRLAEGQTWLVTTAYIGDVVSPTLSSSVNQITSGQHESHFDMPIFPAWIAPVIDEISTATITWEFRVLEADDSEAVALIEASVFDEHNTESIGKQLNPVFNILLRRSDYRLLSVVLDYQGADNRETEVLDLASFEADGISSLPEITDYLVDFVVPEFPLEEAIQEEMTVTPLDDGAVEVAFTSALDGGLIVQRWDAGRPWYTYSRSDTRISWLISR